MLRFLLLAILFFLIIRLVKHAYFNRPSVKGPRSQRSKPNFNNQTRPSNNRFDQIQDADFEVIEDDEEKTRSRE